MILGISFDSLEANKAFREKFELPFDLLCDTDKSVSIAYGAAEDSSSTPSRITCLIDGKGVVAKVYDSVTPAEHAAEVLADLN